MLPDSDHRFAPLLLTACQSRDGYFGRVKKPTARRLVSENLWEPSSLDPHFMLNWQDFAIADALFDSLVRLDPETLEPTADIATHYERNEGATRFVFYLRGNPQPRGIRLRNTDDLREEFRAGKLREDLARDHSAPPDSVPARWSDGKPVTAHDFVYSWRRLFDPKTASPVAQYSTYRRYRALPWLAAGLLAVVAAGTSWVAWHPARPLEKPMMRFSVGRGQRLTTHIRRLGVVSR
jgi:hypothetical protein